ncbi:hypothetical protein NC652_032780 [Populus alba x Populus x berolinensis]|nr:hypothetical protein NC652_032780 [Populus alba x Populus x berolinensis]
MFNSPGLSLALHKPNIDGQGDITRMSENFETSVGRRSREEEHDSRSGSDNMDGASVCLRSVLILMRNKDWNLVEGFAWRRRQVKFWFQNRRTQMKTQLERHENSLLRQENDKLRAENMSIRDAMRNPMCSNSGGPAIIGDISLEEQHLRLRMLG